MTHGLYDQNDGKDNCGFGLIAHLHGEASHRLVRTAIEALASMTHRGGIAADGRTGDGCGLLLQKPDAFLRRAALACGAGELTPLYGVGMLMLSRNEERAATARRILDEELSTVGLQPAGWRPVPTAPSCLGPIALASLPQFAQVFVNAPDLDQAQLTARLFMARRRAEKRLEADADSYIASLSAGTVVYKGLMMPVDLAGFFPDLADPDLASAICLFHQRFSTNTMPRWPLAQPFRLLAHNGEINTITGNRNWAEARTGKFRSPLLPDIEAIAPLVNRTGSDSSSLDNMLEVLVAGGMDLHRAIRMLIPPAWQNVEHLDPDLRAFYEFNSMHTEAWDGPAGLVLTDGRFAVCALDRNGLRPSRWVLSRDDLLTVASEVGVCALDPGEVAAKGRLGPGQLLSVDTTTGTLRHTAEVDDHLKRRHPATAPHRRDAQVGRQDVDERQAVAGGFLWPFGFPIFARRLLVGHIRHTGLGPQARREPQDTLAAHRPLILRPQVGGVRVAFIAPPQELAGRLAVVLAFLRRGLRHLVGQVPLRHILRRPVARLGLEARPASMETLGLRRRHPDRAQPRDKPQGAAHRLRLDQQKQVEMGVPSVAPVGGFKGRHDPFDGGPAFHITPVALPDPKGFLLGLNHRGQGLALLVRCGQRQEDRMEALPLCPFQDVRHLSPPHLCDTGTAAGAEMGAADGEVAQLDRLEPAALFRLAAHGHARRAGHRLPAADRQPLMVPGQTRRVALKPVLRDRPALFPVPILANKLLSSLTKGSRVRAFLARLRRAALRGH